MVTDVNAVGWMSQCSMYVNCQTSNGECISDPLSTYTSWHANTDLDFFFKKGSLYWEKDRWKNVLFIYMLLMCMNTKIRQTYNSFSLLYFIFFLGFVCFALLYAQIRRGIHPLDPPMQQMPWLLNLARWSNCLLLEQHYINGISYEHLLQFLLSTVLVRVMVCK